MSSIKSVADSIEYKLIHSTDIRLYLEELAALRILVFKEFPYLYDGDLEYEKKYLQTYIQSSRSLCVLAYSNQQIIGASTALPLTDEADYVQQPFIQNKKSIQNIFYFGESVLKKEFRGYGIGKSFFQYREQHASSFPEFKTACFCSVVRDLNHPSKPLDYTSHQVFWTKQGYLQDPNMTAFFSWKDLDQKTETEKPMTYWFKELRP